jgi:hypothetical protein
MQGTHLTNWKIEPIWCEPVVFISGDVILLSKCYKKWHETVCWWRPWIAVSFWLQLQLELIDDWNRRIPIKNSRLAFRSTMNENMTPTACLIFTITHNNLTGALVNIASRNLAHHSVAVPCLANAGCSTRFVNHPKEFFRISSCKLMTAGCMVYCKHTKRFFLVSN